MAYTICKPAPPRQGLAFDNYNFEGRRTKKTGIDFQSFEKMHIRRVADLRKGRRCPVPDWAHSDSGLQTALIHYLESRLYIKPNPSDDLKTRLAQCREKAKVLASPLKQRVELWIKNFRAVVDREYHEAEPRIYERIFLATLRGEGPDKVLQHCSQNVSNFDSELYTQEKLAEIVLSALFLYYRMGWNSPSIASELGTKAPHIRQIIHRVSQRVRKTDSLRGRPKKRALHSPH
jgi:hypothetical protein